MVFRVDWRIHLITYNNLTRYQDEWQTRILGGKIDCFMSKPKYFPNPQCDAW